MKNRLIAFLIHISLSVLIGITALMMVFFVWYPSPLADAQGVTEIFVILLAVDISVGPMLTFIIYQPFKKNLTFDLAVISILQIAALSYGLFTIFQGRPAFIVYAKDRFESISTLDIDPKSAKKALEASNPMAQPSWFMPRWVAALESTDADRRQEILFSSVLGGYDWAQLPELYHPLASVKSEILSHAKPLAELKRLHNNNPDIEEKLKNYDDNIGWLPLKAKMQNMTVLVNTHSAEIIKIIDVTPWP